MATIAERVARVIAECSGVWGQSGITSWEQERLEEWKHRSSLSARQEEILSQIEKKAFPEEDDDG